MLRTLALLACSAVAGGFNVAGTPQMSTAARAASPAMMAKGPFDLTGQVAMVAGVADSTGCALLPPV